MQPSTSIVPAQPAALARVDTAAQGGVIQPYSPPVAMPPPGYFYPPQHAPAPPAANETVVSIADLIAYIRKYWKLSVLLALPLSGLVFFYLGFGKKVFETEAKMLIHIQASNPIQFTGTPTNNGMTEMSAPMIINNHRTGLKTRRYTDYLFSKLPRPQLESFLADEGKLGMKSRLFIAIGLAQPPKPALPEELFAGKIDKAVRIEPVKDSHILRVIVRDSDPASAATMANAYVDNYISYVSDDALQSTRQNSVVLQRQGEEIMEKLAAAEKKLQDYVKNADLLKLSATGDMGSQRADALARAVNEADLEWLKSTISLNSLRTATKPGADITGVKGVAEDPQVVDLRRRLDEARAKRTALDEWCGRLHPRVVTLEKDISRLQEQISKTTSGRVGDLILAAEVEEKRLRSQAEQLREQLTHARGDALTENSKQTTLSLLNDEVASLRDLYNQVTRSRKQTDVTREFKDGQLTVEDIAVAPDAPISPKKSIALIAGMMVFGILGLGVPIGLGLADDHLMPLLKGTPPARNTAPPAYQQPAPQQAPMPAPSPFAAVEPPPQQHLQPAQHARIGPASVSATQILATLPELMSGEGPIQLGELLHPSPVSGGGAITQLIALLEKQSIYRSGPGVIFITSANVGEGKSLLASALAACFCTTGRRVFLMECNPTAPSIQNWFPQAGGYSSWTNELETLRYGKSNLFLLPAHDLPSYEVTDLVDGYRAWIEKAKPQVDWIIMDGSSLLRGFADVAQLAPLATDVLFVHDATRCGPDQVRAALNLLRPLTSIETMRGMVMNRQTTCAI